MRGTAEGLRKTSVYVSQLAFRVVDRALELFVYLVGHADTAGTDRVSKALETAVHVDRQASGTLKEAIFDVLPSAAALAETEVLIYSQLCD